MTHLIETPRGNNIGNNIKDYLTSRGIYGKVNILTIHTERNVRQRVNITIVKTDDKP